MKLIEISTHAFLAADVTAITVDKCVLSVWLRNDAEGESYDFTYDTEEEAESAAQDAIRTWRSA